MGLFGFYLYQYYFYSELLFSVSGASGAGKTSFLNALNFRNQGNLSVKGEIRLKRHLLNSVEEIASISGYVQQDDLFVGCMTVRENLIFQAFLRMDKKYTDQERYDRVEVRLYPLFLKALENKRTQVIYNHRFSIISHVKLFFSII